MHPKSLLLSLPLALACSPNTSPYTITSLRTSQTSPTLTTISFTATRSGETFTCTRTEDDEVAWFDTHYTPCSAAGMKFTTTGFDSKKPDFAIALRREVECPPTEGLQKWNWTTPHVGQFLGCEEQHGRKECVQKTKNVILAEWA